MVVTYGDGSHAVSLLGPDTEIITNCFGQSRADLSSRNAKRFTSAGCMVCCKTCTRVEATVTANSGVIRGSAETELKPGSFSWEEWSRVSRSTLRQVSDQATVVVFGPGFRTRPGPAPTENAV
ncbi:hypothetical protein LSAT2_004983, partial [Lamellibrachia satsuma]